MAGPGADCRRDADQHTGMPLPCYTCYTGMPLPCNPYTISSSHMPGNASTTTKHQRLGLRTPANTLPEANPSLHPAPCTPAAPHPRPQGRALVASRSIRQGEVVVELPDGAVLMAENCGIADVLEGGAGGQVVGLCYH